MGDFEKGGPNAETNVIWVKQFRHWRSGKIIKAEDYGKTAFPLRIRKRKK